MNMPVDHYPWSEAPVVDIDDASLTYDGESSPALRNVNVRIEPGELVAVIGRTGSGKSSLLGLLTGLVPHFTGGTVGGRVVVAGRDIATRRPSDLAEVVGFVGQEPSAGFVTDTVEDELAYGMEQLGVPAQIMRRRVEETLDLLGIAELRDASVHELSGGQQQRVAIGSVLVMHPQLLVLDEPTSALDPTAAEDVLASLTRLVHDLGVTVVLAEHRIERVMPFADQVIHVGADGVVTSGRSAEILEVSDLAPPVVEFGRAMGWAPLPLTIRDARRALTRAQPELKPVVEVEPRTLGETLLEARALRVNLGGLDVVGGQTGGVDLTLRAGGVSVLMGRNGCGKSTLLWALQGSGKRDGGSLDVGEQASDPAQADAGRRRGLVGLVPQNSSDLLYLESVADELRQADQDAGATAGTSSQLLERLAPGIPRDRHPRDLSVGQQLALVLAIQLAAAPAVLLLDEPTRGLDYAGKDALIRVLRERADAGHAVMVATHDVEFAAAVADEVLLMAGGEIIGRGPTSDVLPSSTALAPQMAKVMSPLPALTADDALAHFVDDSSSGDSRGVSR